MAKSKKSKPNFKAFDKAAESYLPKNAKGEVQTALMTSKRNAYNERRRISNGGKGG